MRGPLTSVDAAWLRMDDATNLMVVTGVLVLDAPVSFDQVRAWLERRVPTLPRFTDRVVDPPGGVGVPSWEPDPRFSVENHLFQLELPPPGDERALQALVGRLMSQPLNTAQPLWRFYLVPRFQGGSALIGRVHQVVAAGGEGAYQRHGGDRARRCRRRRCAADRAGHRLPPLTAVFPGLNAR